jgi:hypothetical protein
VSTFSAESLTRRSESKQSNYRRRGPFAGSVSEQPFECELPIEARTEWGISGPQTYRKPRIQVRAVGRYIPEATSVSREELTPQEVVSLRPPPLVTAPRQAVTAPPQPILPLPPSVTPPIARPAPSESRGGNGGWWLLAILIGLPLLLLSRLGHDGVQPQSQPVEVRRALPAVEVRKALPVTSVASTIPQWGWQSIRMPDGEIENVHYDGALPSSGNLPDRGAYPGQEFSVGATSLVWMVARGTSFPAWIDP